MNHKVLMMLEYHHHLDYNIEALIVHFSIPTERCGVLIEVESYPMVG